MAAEADGVEFHAVPGGVEFDIKVIPGASRTRIVGAWGTALKVAIAAPPEGGQANAAVAALLAAALGVKKAAVSIVRGHTQPRKRIGVRGLTVQEVRVRLARA